MNERNWWLDEILCPKGRLRCDIVLFPGYYSAPDWTEGEMGLCERVVRTGVADLGPLDESNMIFTAPWAALISFRCSFKDNVRRPRTSNARNHPPKLPRRSGTAHGKSPRSMTKSVQHPPGLKTPHMWLHWWCWFTARVIGFGPERQMDWEDRFLTGLLLDHLSQAARPRRPQ